MMPPKHMGQIILVLALGAGFLVLSILLSIGYFFKIYYYIIHFLLFIIIF